jgi:hypothetical protein
MFKTKYAKKMAISQNPMTGKMSGTMGNFVTSSLGSKNIVRAKAFGGRDANSEAQQMQRGGFKLIGQLFPMLGSIPEEGFVQRDSETSVFAAFMAVNLKSAIDKSGTEAAVDYSKLVVANGTMAPLIVKSASISAEGVRIGYKPSLKNQVNRSTDIMVALALTRTGELWIERQPRGEDAEATILIPMEGVVANDILGVYLFATRADGSKVTKSVYLPLA